MDAQLPKWQAILTQMKKLKVKLEMEEQMRDINKYMYLLYCKEKESVWMKAFLNRVAHLRERNQTAKDGDESAKTEWTQLTTSPITQLVFNSLKV